ncbi:MAG: hypothetical protein KBD63_03935 [Bacteriovoracaceae bacterium]|nr:hypothetical protein [Bacteriovoracaceae bacterium]
MYFYFLIILSSVFVSACSSSQKNSAKLDKAVYLYDFVDPSGSYILRRTLEHKKNTNQFELKAEIYGLVAPQKLVEKTLSISDLGYIKKAKQRIPSMRPLSSQHIVWLEGKQYQTSSVLNNKNKELSVTTKSPEAKWNGTEKILVPRGSGAYCYFSQLVECVAYTGFFERAKKDNTQELFVKVIWDGYPFFQDQYLNIPGEVFADAVFRFEGKTDQDYFAYQLEIVGQIILYHLDNDFNLVNMFWISQGLNITRREKK